MLCRKHNFRRQIHEPSIKGRTSSTAHSPGGGGGQFTADLFLFAKVPEEESTAAIVAFPIEEDDDEDEHPGGDTDTHGDHVLPANARNQSKIRCAVNVSVFTVKGWPNRISHHDV